MAPSSPPRPRALVLASEPLASRMAGPAIRALELARALTAVADVTVAAPAGSEPVPGLRMELVEPTEHRRTLALAREHDVVVVQHAPPQLLLALAREDVRVVCDLYTPILLEALEAGRERGPRARRTIQRLATRQTVAALAVADLVLCASERQRDLWLGALTGRELLDLRDYDADPSLRGLVAVVPFGMAAEPPAPAPSPVMKDVLPGVDADDRVLLWGGGIWDWLDALTPMRAVQRLRETRDDVHLVFLGGKRPAVSEADQMGAYDEAVAFAADRGLLGACVHLHEGWVPYAERGGWLLEADVGVTAHHDHAETRFAFRTRVLDYLWAGLPVVGTAGDTLIDLAGEGGVPVGDDAAFAAAVARVLDAGPGRDAAVARAAELRADLTWERAAAPLLAFVDDHAARPRRHRDLAAVTRATVAQYPGTLARTVRDEGAGTAARRVARNAARLVGKGP
ncbi:MAG: glycosyltransferase [Solirubrobacteraceae bacterium]|nr:glycosyltransferase [Solirubrobacteraceae bacterium]